MMERSAKWVGRLLIATFFVLFGFMLYRLSPEMWTEFWGAFLIVIPIMAVFFIFLNWNLIR